MIMKKFKEEKIIYKLMTLMLLAGMIFFVFRIIYSCVRGLPYPSEQLEPSNIALTRMFRNGTTPYTLASLDLDVLAVNYEYPFLGSVFALVLSYLVGGNIVLAHYIISFAAIIGTGVLGYLIVDRYSKTTASPVAAAILFMMCHWRFGYVSAAPDDLGLFFFVLTLYLSVSPKIKHKPLICAILTTVCFYTKQYFIVAALGIFIYMFLYSKKTAWKFLLYTLVINVVVGAIITIVWPLYWSHTIFFLYFGCVLGTGFGIANLIGQMRYLLAIFVGMFGVLFVAAIVYIRKKRASKEKEKKSWLNVHENDAFALFIVQIPVMMVPLVVLGRNDGAFLSYFLQLWMPAVIVVTLIILEKMVDGSNKLLLDLVYGGVVAFTVLFCYLKLPLHTLTDEEIAMWEDTYAMVNEYEASGDVVYCSQLAYLAFENDSPYLFCGHDGEVSEYTLGLWEQSPISQVLFPYVDDIIEATVTYKNSIIYPGFDSKYNLLAFEDGNSLMFSEDFVEGRPQGYTTYEVFDRRTLRLGNAEYTVSFARLKP